ncbi:hypothetical protein cypCar_00025245 [Cyprinus carpio]|nr:hypothetical protein cypCar_00025245 [Cyprinus carpio]
MQGTTQDPTLSTRMEDRLIHPSTLWIPDLKVTIRMIPTVEEIRDTAGMMDKILVTGKLNVNQRGQVLEPANTQTDPIPDRGIKKTFLDPAVVPMMTTMQTTIRDRSRWYDPNAAYDPRYRAYYDQAYGWYYGDAYYNQQYQNSRKEGYDDPWRYYPGYDSSFDDECRRRDPYVDDFDRRSVHSEQSAHSVRSSHSRRSSFSSRSQQSQVYRSQPDLVNAAYDATGMTFPADYTYSQYPNPSDTVDYSQIPYSTDNTWTAPEQPPPRPLTPEKFSVPHRCARFGPAGQLILVQPNLPSAGQPTLVEIHSMETILQDSPEQSEMRSFPGPLVKEETHKVDVIKFAQNKAQECLRNDDLLDKDSAYLIWEFIVLLCRQNGTVVGTDIADLLLKEHRSVWLPGKSPNEANLIDFNNEAIEHAEEEEAGPISLLSDTLMGVPENVGKETERFRELLLFGRKKARQTA